MSFKNRTITIAALAFATLTTSPAADFRHFITSNTMRRIATGASCLLNMTDYAQTNVGVYQQGFTEVNAPGLVSKRNLFLGVKLIPCGAAVAGEIVPRVFHMQGSNLEAWNAIMMSVGAGLTLATVPAVLHNYGTLSK